MKGEEKIPDEVNLPKILPPLDLQFRPIVLLNHVFHSDLARTGVPAAISIEREAGEISRFNLAVFPQDHPRFQENFPYMERIIKFLIWQRGGHTIHIGGLPGIADHLRTLYSPEGARKFDFHFISDQVYERKLKIYDCKVEEVPAGNEMGKSLGGHVNGCRVGFDLGASDRKVCAVRDGELLFSEEVIWDPRSFSDPQDHYREIIHAIRSAAARLPQLDAVGGSVAGIYINNQPRVASLFRGVPREKYDDVRTLFLRIRDELGVPLVLVNDGDVAALAGSLALGKYGVLGIALGSSEAGGYVNHEGHIMGWLNELSFAPVDGNPTAPMDEWSGDRGCGASYFSQQAVFRLALAAGIEVPTGITAAEKLQFIQQKLEAGHPAAERIWQSMAVYLGYGVAYYADFYAISHVLILGRCTSGKGGTILLEGARKVLETEFPELQDKLQLHLPDEKMRRHGQAYAAASLPEI